MAIEEGQSLPAATLLGMNSECRPAPVELADKISGRKVVIFGLPGAYTGTGTSAHVPSFIRTIGALKDKGVDEVICVSVNDPFVMGAWGEATGGTAAGITFLGDADGSFTKALGMDFDAPPVGFHGRSKRYALVAEDGVDKTLHAEESPGVCDTSGGEAILATL